MANHPNRSKKQQAQHTPGPFKGYHERKADEAFEAFAGPFYRTTKAEYRNCKTAADLHALSRKCWKEANYATRTINRNGYDNMTRHGCMPYDKYSALHEQARSLAIDFYHKAKRIEAGEAVEAVMPHLARAAIAKAEER